MKLEDYKRDVATVVWVFAVGVGFLGAFLVAYSLIAFYTQPWEPMEKIAPFASAMVTLLATILTAASVYLPPENMRPAWTVSKVMVSPIVIVACGLALWTLFSIGHLSPVLVNGFGLMAIAGALIRMLPFPKEN